VHPPEVTEVTEEPGASEEPTGATQAPGLYCNYSRRHSRMHRDAKQGCEWKISHYSFEL